MDYEIFELGDFVLQNGATLRGCKLAYKTFGTLNAAKDNVIVYPTWYSRPARRQRVAHWRGHGARPGEPVHHHPQHVRQRPVLLAEQHARTV